MDHSLKAFAVFPQELAITGRSTRCRSHTPTLYTLRTAGRTSGSAQIHRGNGAVTGLRFRHRLEVKEGSKHGKSHWH